MDLGSDEKVNKKVIMGWESFGVVGFDINDDDPITIVY